MELKYIEPIHVSNAIRTCWSSFDKSDNGGSKDMALIKRVGIKYRHLSTLEHCKIIIETNFLDEFLLRFFTNNKYSDIYIDDEVTIVATNLRVIIENYAGNEHYFYNIIPEPYRYLVEKGQ
jgi:hypothetical protein